MDIQDCLDFRRDRDEFFESEHDSPPGYGDHSDFAGPDDFEPASELVFTVSAKPDDGSEIRIPTYDELGFHTS